jgi:hypothetical protein
MYPINELIETSPAREPEKAAHKKFTKVHQSRQYWFGVKRYLKQCHIELHR